MRGQGGGYLGVWPWEAGASRICTFWSCAGHLLPLPQALPYPPTRLPQLEEVPGRQLLEAAESQWGTPLLRWVCTLGHMGAP